MKEKKSDEEIALLVDEVEKRILDVMLTIFSDYEETKVKRIMQRITPFLREEVDRQIKGAYIISAEELNYVGDYPRRTMEPLCHNFDGWRYMYGIPNKDRK